MDENSDEIKNNHHNEPDSEVEKALEETSADDTKVEELAKPERKSAKAWLPWVIIILVFILVFVVALFAMNARYNQSQERQITETTLFDKNTLPRIDASLATQPLTDAFVKDFTGQTTEEMGVEYSNETFIITERDNTENVSSVFIPDEIPREYFNNNVKF